MRRLRKALAFALLALLLLSSISAFSQSTAVETVAELSVILSTYLSPSGENFGKPMPERIKKFFNIEDAEKPAARHANPAASQMPAESTAIAASVAIWLKAHVPPIIAEASAEEPEPMFELSEFRPKSDAAQAPEAGVETVPAPASGPFTVSALNFLDTVISGTGLPGAEIVAYVSGEILTATVDSNGAWRVVLPDWIFLMEGNEVRVTHVVPVEEPEEGLEAGEADETDAAEQDEVQVIEEILLFVSRQQSMQPTVGDFDNTMAIISGTGVPNARITVSWPDSTLSVYEPVMLTGYWGIETGGKKWKPGDKIYVIQQEQGLQPSEPKSITVVEQSPQPAVDSLSAGSTQVTGTGVGGASISILSSAGFNGSVMLAMDETQWAYNIPEGISLSAGDVVRLYQKVPGRTQSEWLEITIGG